MYLNLAMWIDFVFCSLYSVHEQKKAYLLFREKLTIVFILCAIFIVLAPIAAVTFINCGDTRYPLLALYIIGTMLFLSVVTPTVGAVLLYVLKKHFPVFYTLIRKRTFILILVQGTSFACRGIFDLL